MPRSPEGSAYRQFGKNVRLLRNELGYSQEGFAELSGYHRTYIGGIERGERNPTLKTMLHLATTLGVELEVLLSGVMNVFYEASSGPKLKVAESKARYTAEKKSRKKKKR